MNKGPQAGDDPIRGTQVGRTRAPAIENEQLMPDQRGFGDNETESTRPRQSGQGDDQMNEYDSEVAHSGNGINSPKTRTQANLAIRHSVSRSVLFETRTVRERSGDMARGWSKAQLRRSASIVRILLAVPNYFDRDYHVGELDFGSPLCDRGRRQ
jgi:hypothetical protein